ncbi:hypothetical protein [Mesorhizobium sp. M0118]|uniref:hypothetical protein n=1 Tax=Mesorhizobium sp. M0118 TaxID=2956884 RepID=UPI0033384B2D
MASSDRLNAVFDYVDESRIRYLERLMEYPRHPSISADNVGIAEVGTRLVEMLTEMGLETSLVPTAGIRW